MASCILKMTFVVILLGCGGPSRLDVKNARQWSLWDTTKDGGCMVYGQRFTSDDFELMIEGDSFGLLLFKTSDLERIKRGSLNENTVLLPLGILSVYDHTLAADAVAVARDAAKAKKEYSVGIYPYYDEGKLVPLYDSVNALRASPGTWIAVDRNGNVVGAKPFSDFNEVNDWADSIFAENKL